MRRQANAAAADESSLELLLDTICNTFGGVLFISLLVVILLNMTSEEVAPTPPDEESQAKLEELHRQLEESNQQLQTLQSAIDRQKQLEKRFVLPETRELAQEWRRKTDANKQLADAKNSTLGRISETQIEVNQKARELQSKKEALARAKAELSALEKRLQTEIATRSRSAKLPRQRRSTKREAPFFLKNGRLGAYARKDRGGNLVPNTADFVEKTDEKGRYVELKPGSGLMIDLEGRSDESIERTFAAFDKDQDYLAVFVWPDSFQHFERAKDAMVRLGFEYRLVPMPADGRVYFGRVGEAMVQ